MSTVRIGQRDAWRYALGGALTTAGISAVTILLTIHVMKEERVPSAIIQPAPQAPVPCTPPVATIATASPTPEPPPATMPAPPRTAAAERLAVGPRPVVRAPATESPTGGIGAITVVCTPKCDAIFDNGKSLGPGHVFNRPVEAGPHTLSLSTPNGVRKTVTVEVYPQITREIRMSMLAANERPTAKAKSRTCDEPPSVDESGIRRYVPECDDPTAARF